MILIDDLTLCSFYSLLLILFHRWTLFKMLALEKSAEKWPFTTGGGGHPTGLTLPPWLRDCDLIICQFLFVLLLNISKKQQQLSLFFTNFLAQNEYAWSVNHCQSTVKISQKQPGIFFRISVTDIVINTCDHKRTLLFTLWLCSYVYLGHYKQET